MTNDKRQVNTERRAFCNLTDGPEIMKGSGFIEYLWQFSLF